MEECSPIYEKQIQLVKTEVCNNQLAPKCTPVMEEVCKTICKTVNERIVDDFDEEVCKDVEVTKCDNVDNACIIRENSIFDCCKTSLTQLLHPSIQLYFTAKYTIF